MAQKELTISQEVFLDSLSGILNLLKDSIIELRNIESAFTSMRATLLRIEEKIDMQSKTKTEDILY